MRAAPLLLVLAAGAAAACSEGENHLLSGQQYVPSGMCLAPEQAIDDVAGPDNGQSCAPTCLLATGADGGEVVFITTTCGPFPGYFRSESQDAATSANDECRGAFAAFAAGVECGPDGTAPEAGADATTDAHGDAGSDSGSASDSGSPSDSPTGS